MSDPKMSALSGSVRTGLNNISDAIKGALGSGRDSIAESVKTALLKEAYGTKESRIETAIYKGLRDGIREGMIAAEKLRIANDNKRSEP